MKKLDFTPKNVINCVDNEPALWVLKLLHVSTHIIGFHFWKQCYTHHICVCL